MEAKELFISYGREPIVSKFVEKLKTDLETVGFSVWLDSRDIPAGSDWHSAIGAGLSRCKAILPVITNKYLSSRYCVNELYTADSDKKLIFPIMLEDVDFEASESGHGVKFTISSVNWTMCGLGLDDYNTSLSNLISSMKNEGLGAEEVNAETRTQDSSPATTVFTPLIGPVSTLPFKVIPDVENPEGIATTSDGGLVVTTMRHKVLIFNSNHEKTMELGGDPGLGMGQFLSPTGIAVDSEGHILVASHYYIKRFSLTGKCLQQAGGTEQDGSLSIDSPRGLALGKGGRIYITEQQKHRVTILNPDLSLYKRFSDADRMLGSGHLNMPQGLAVSSSGDVYVADMLNHVVQVFDAEGTFQFRFGGMRQGPGTTMSPTAVAIDTEDYVYVGCATCTVSIFTAEGKFVRTFGQQGVDVGKFSMIRALHLDQHGVLYVGEWTANRIQMFRTLETAVGDEAVAEMTGQTQGLSLQSSSGLGPLQPSPLATATLNITGEGRGMALIGGGGGVVNIGPGVVFRSHVGIQPGANVISQFGTNAVPVPVAVPPSDGRGQQSGGRGQDSGGVIFAKSASTPCKQAGIREPVKILKTECSVYSIAVSEDGAMVISGKTLVLYNAYHDLLHHTSEFSSNCVAFEDKQTIVAVSSVHIARLDMQLKVLYKVNTGRTPGLTGLTHPYAMAVGSQGQLYIVGVKKCHIINAGWSQCETFAETCGQAFAIAVGTCGNVYLPVQMEHTVWVFSPDGYPLFQFGGPDRAPVPHMSLHVPMSIALDHHDNVYVGTGMQSITKFDSKGKFLEEFAARVNFEALPQPICTGPDRHRLYVAMLNTNKLLMYDLTDS